MVRLENVSLEGWVEVVMLLWAARLRSLKLKLKSSQSRSSLLSQYVSVSASLRMVERLQIWGCMEEARQGELRGIKR